MERRWCEIMEDLRKNAPDEICGKKVLWMSDYQASVKKSRRRGRAGRSSAPLQCGGIRPGGRQCDCGAPLRYRAENQGLLYG